MRIKNKKWWRQIAAVIALSLAALVADMRDGAQSDAQTSEAAMRCEIELKTVEDAIQLRGVAFSQTQVDGYYEFEVRKEGNGGLSTTRQAGTFNAGPDSPAKVGMVQFGGNKAAYRVKLTLKWQGHQTACEKTIDWTREI